MTFDKVTFSEISFAICSSVMLSEEELKQQPLAGSVFRIKDVGVCGVQGVSYAG